MPIRGSGVSRSVSDLIRATVSIAGGVWRSLENKLGDHVSVKDLGAVCDGVTNDTGAVNAATSYVAGAGGGTVYFPNGLQNFTFTAPPDGVSWSFAGPSVSRLQLGGTNPNVRFNRATLDYHDGPHVGVRREAQHIRMIARGSGSIASPSGDISLGIHTEKYNWTATASLSMPVGGQTIGLYIIGRDGAAVGEAVSTGPAGIIGDFQNLDGSGYSCFTESTMASVSRNAQTVVESFTLQLQPMFNRSATSSAYSYGVYLRSDVGDRSAAIRVEGSSSSSWTRIVENLVGTLTNFFIDVTGRIRWRSTGAENISLDFDDAAASLAFRNNSSVDVFRVEQSRVAFGSYTATAITATGFIEIEDAAGNVRRLLVG